MSTELNQHSGLASSAFGGHDESKGDGLHGFTEDDIDDFDGDWEDSADDWGGLGPTCAELEDAARAGTLNLFDQCDQPDHGDPEAWVPPAAVERYTLPYRAGAFEVRIIRSARRVKTISARLIDGVIQVRVPVRMAPAEEVSAATELAERIARRKRCDHISLKARAEQLAASLRSAHSRVDPVV